MTHGVDLRAVGTLCFYRRISLVSFGAGLDSRLHGNDDGGGLRGYGVISRDGSLQRARDAQVRNDCGERRHFVRST